MLAVLQRDTSGACLAVPTSNKTPANETVQHICIQLGKRQNAPSETTGRHVDDLRPVPVVVSLSGHSWSHYMAHRCAICPWIIGQEMGSEVAAAPTRRQPFPACMR